jgi:hypothetical protein
MIKLTKSFTASYILGAIIGYGLCSSVYEVFRDGNNRIDEQQPIIEILRDPKTKQEFRMEYKRFEKGLRNSCNERIEADDQGCITRLSGSIPGAVKTCISGNKVHIEHYGSPPNGWYGITSVTETTLDSNEVKDYIDRFYRDKDLLINAGLIK